MWRTPFKSSHLLIGLFPMSKNSLFPVHQYIFGFVTRVKIYTDFADFQTFRVFFFIHILNYLGLPLIVGRPQRKRATHPYSGGYRSVWSKNHCETISPFTHRKIFRFQKFWDFSDFFFNLNIYIWIFKFTKRTSHFGCKYLSDF